MENLAKGGPIPIRFRNRPCILIATGPSLTETVVETLRKYKDNFLIMGCNDAYKIVDFLDIHYACDDKWWEHNGIEFREKFPSLESWSQCRQELCDKYSLNRLVGEHKDNLSHDSKKIHFGSNSGFQLLNLAWLFGCSKFYLVGYNMQMSQGKRHFFGDHPKGLNNNSPYPRFVQSFDRIDSRIKPLIINCTPDSALKMFRYVDLETALCK